MDFLQIFKKCGRQECITWCCVLWDPQGWQLVVDELPHTIIPLLFLLYWFLFAKRRNLYWKMRFGGYFIHLFICFMSFLGGHNWFVTLSFIDVPALDITG